MVDDRMQDLGKRLKAVRSRHAVQTVGDGISRGRAASGMAVGLRIAIEMVAGLAVGVVGGLLLDRQLGTTPWLLIIGFILGSGASFANVLRTARELDARAARERAAAAGEDETSGDGKSDALKGEG